jgi:hypothetical protein
MKDVGGSIDHHEKMRFSSFLIPVGNKLSLFEDTHYFDYFFKTISF